MDKMQLQILILRGLLGGREHAGRDERNNDIQLHVGQCADPAVGGDIDAFERRGGQSCCSCFLAAASKIARFSPFGRVPRLTQVRQVSSIPLHLLFRPNPLRWASVEFPVLPHGGAASGFWFPMGTRPAVPGKSDTAGRTGGFLLCLSERF